MKILFLQHGLGYGGATKSLIVMLKALHGSIELHTISQKVNPKSRHIINEIKNYSFFSEMNFPSIYSYSANIISQNSFNKAKEFYPRDIIDYININSIDIVHINSSLFSHFLRPIKSSTTARIVVHLREYIGNNISELNKFIIDNHIKYSDSIIAISDNELKYYPDNDRMYVISNPHEFEQTDKLLKVNKTSPEIKIGMCSNFLEYKGHMTFLEVINILNRSGIKNKLKFVIIGYPKETLKECLKRYFKPGYKQRFDKMVKEFKISNLEIVKYTLNIYEEVSKLDIYVRPEYTGHPWGRDIIEAMALKKPIIATGQSEFYIESGITGYLVQPRDAKMLSDKIIQLINNPQERHDMGEAGYRKIKGMCDMDNYGKRIISIYQDILSAN